MATEIVNATGSRFIPLNELLLQDSTLQITLSILVVGLIAIFLANRKISGWVDKNEINYIGPHTTEFIKKIVLSLFAVALIVSVSAYIQVFELFDT